MKVLPTTLEEVLIIEPRVFQDTRGFFMETFHKKKYKDIGIDCTFVQDNLSYSVQGTLRGLHYQLKHAQAKLIQVIKGAIFDVAVDIRLNSPTFGKWTGVELTDEDRRQLFIPEGFAHGFCVLSKTAYVTYKCTDLYAPDDEGGVLYADPDIGIKWPVSDPVLSEKDRAYPWLTDISQDRLPVYQQ
jgi:dTDP-4-dehydrorhamnose 3,5-epimerase